MVAYILPQFIWGTNDKNNDVRRGLRVKVKSGGLPVGAGLGSSAAFSVATAGALLRLRQLMFADFLSQGPNVTLEDITGSGTDGYSPPTSVLHTINEWAFGE
jgi:hypothetical protein